MPDSDRRDLGSNLVLVAAVVVFAALVLVAVAGVAAQNAYRIAAGEDRAERYNACRQSSERSLVPFLFDSCSPTEPNAENDSKTAEYDLAAQNRMADWTAILVIVSGAGFVLSGLGVWLVKLTFDKTGDAVAAARAANEIAADTAKRQLRAYVGVDAIIVSRYAPGQRSLIMVRFKNTGATPARRFAAYCGTTRMQDPDAKFSFPARNGKPSVREIGADETYEIPLRTENTLGEPDYLSVIEGRQYQVVAGYARYLDVFGKRHLLVFRGHIVLVDEGDFRVSVSSRNNRSS